MLLSGPNLMARGTCLTPDTCFSSYKYVHHTIDRMLLFGLFFSAIKWTVCRCLRISVLNG